ncbi:ClbS/DfsB family four-helix bundle protein [bacterium]|nr:ClbS/DfsB family four-helix bundle protein [bacterium]
MRDLETYIHRFETAHAEMRAIVQLAKDNPLIYQPWRMKEVLDHLTGWDDAVIASIRAVLSGQMPETPAARGVDVYNAQTVSSRESLPYTVTQREWEFSRAELLRLLRTMTTEQLYQSFVLPWGGEGTIADIVEIFAEHEENHAREISQIIRPGGE